VQEPAALATTRREHKWPTATFHILAVVHGTRAPHMHEHVNAHACSADRATAKGANKARQQAHSKCMLAGQQDLYTLRYGVD
jgi:hypothetical protein